MCCKNQDNHSSQFIEILKVKTISARVCPAVPARYCFFVCVSLVFAPVVVANQPRNNVCFDTGRHEIKLGTNLA